jgi:serine O-acetyltransferase
MTITTSRVARSLRRRWRDFVAKPYTENTETFWTDVHSRHPPFVAAVLADARITAANRGDRYEYRSTADAAMQALRLAFVSDSFLAQALYRAKARCQSRHIPVLPGVLHHLAMTTGQICIGDPVVVAAGVFIPHGQIVVDGMTDIASGVMLGPFVVVGLVTGEVRGPTIGARTRIGVGAKVLGPIVVGADAIIGANAVVISDVPAGATAVGVPARTVS